MFGGIVLGFADAGDSPGPSGAALGCLVGGAVVSYAKARAEGSAWSATSASPSAPSG